MRLSKITSLCFSFADNTSVDADSHSTASSENISASTKGERDNLSSSWLFVVECHVTMGNAYWLVFHVTMGDAPPLTTPLVISFPFRLLSEVDEAHEAMVAELGFHASPGSRQPPPSSSSSSPPPPHGAPRRMLSSEGEERSLAGSSLTATPIAQSPQCSSDGKEGRYLKGAGGGGGHSTAQSSPCSSAGKTAETLSFSLTFSHGRKPGFSSVG